MLAAIPSSESLPVVLFTVWLVPLPVKVLPLHVPNSNDSDPVPTLALALEKPSKASVWDLARLLTAIS